MSGREEAFHQMLTHMLAQFTRSVLHVRGIMFGTLPPVIKMQVDVPFQEGAYKVRLSVQEVGAGGRV